MSGHDYPQGRRAAMIASAAKLRALTADLDALATGHLPDAALLADAPILDHWKLAERRKPCLIGMQTGHPLLPPNTAIYTSGLYFLDPEAGIARTLSRWYRLGRERNQSSEINFSISSGTCEPAIRRPRHPRDI